MLLDNLKKYQSFTYPVALPPYKGFEITNTGLCTYVGHHPNGKMAQGTSLPELKKMIRYMLAP